MIRVLITGASGFIGIHCLRRLRTETCEIHAVNRAGQGEGGDRVKWHAADLRDPVQAEALVAKIHSDASAPCRLGSDATRLQ